MLVLETQVEKIASAVASVSALSPKDSPMPIYHYLVFDRQEDQLVLIGSDGKNQLTCRVDVADCHGQPDSFAIPAKKISDILRALDKDATLSISHEDNGRVTLASKRSRFTLNAIEHERFMPIEQGDPSGTFVVTQKHLLSCFKRVDYAVADKNDVRPLLRGIHVDVDPVKERVRLTATNSHHLALMVTDAAADGHVDFILPPKTADYLVKTLSNKSEDEVVVTTDGKTVKFLSGDIELVAKLIDGQYPNVDRIIPVVDDTYTLIEVERDDLVSAINRVSIVAGFSDSEDMNKKIKPTIFQVERDELILKGSNAGQEQAEEHIIVLDVRGNSLSVGYNAKYLLDMLRTLGNEDDVLRIAMVETRPMLVEIKDNDAFKYILMPMRF